MRYFYEGVTCDDYGTPRGKRSHYVECDEEGEHLPGTCRLVQGSMTMSLAEAGDAYKDVPRCKACHTTPGGDAGQGKQ